MTSADNPGVAAWPPLLYGSAFLVVLALRWFWPTPMFGAAGVFWPGVAFVVVGAGIMLWGRITLLAAGTNINPSRPTIAIVTSGPYRFSRNPLYVAITLIYAGLTIAENTWWGIVVLVPVLVIMYRGVILREERYLDRKFGQRYQEYRAKVRRFI